MALYTGLNDPHPLDLSDLVDPEAPAAARYHRQAVEHIIQCVDDGVYCALLGPRLSGKTVMLRYVERILSESLGYTVVYIDLMHMRASTLQEFFAHLIQVTSQRLHELSRQPIPAPGSDIASSAVFRAYLSDCVIQLEKNIVIIIEHLETVPTDLVQALLTSLRAAYMDQQTIDYQVMVVVSGALSLATLTVGEASPFRGIARRVFVGDLSTEESKALINENLSESGIELTPQAIRHLLEATRGDSYLIRSIVQRCAALAFERPIARLGAGTIRRVTNRFLRNDVFQYAPLLEAVRMIEENPDLLRCILLLLERGSVRKAELPLPLSPDLDPLYLTGVVETQDGDSYRLQNRIYKEFLAHHFYPGRVGHMLAMAGYWDTALDYLETSMHEDNENPDTDLLPATITSMYAAEDPVQAAHYLGRGLKAAFGVRKLQIWYAPPHENRLELVHQGGEIQPGATRLNTRMPLQADQLEARAYRQATSLRGQEDGQFIRRAIPLTLPRSRPIGVVTIWENVADWRFVEQRQRDLKLVSYLNQAARALEAVSQRRQELVLAGRMQATLLPTALPKLAGWQFSAFWKPARETSGDFYDLLNLPENKIGLVIADVVDKGMGAALYMALSRTLMRTFAADHPNRPDLVLQAVNRRMLEEAGAGHFVTLFYGILDPSNGQLIYSNGGHVPPCHQSARQSQPPAYLSRTGMALGVEEETSWEHRSIMIDPGDAMIMYTDGILDALNPAQEIFGDQRLMAVISSIASLADRSAQKIQDNLLGKVQAFVGDAHQYDDITVLTVLRL
jgi:serine phosphatase RsbU (regulator of sigma subunit)